MKNELVFEGVCGRDCELKHLPSGVEFAQVNIANSEEWVDKKTNEKQKRTTWVTVKAFGDRAVKLADIAFKGNTILVSGKLSTREYDKRDGTKAMAVECNAFEIELIRRKKPFALKDEPTPTTRLSYQRPVANPDYSAENIPF